jgi:hypothetical protein
MMVRDTRPATVMGNRTLERVVVTESVKLSQVKARMKLIGWWCYLLCVASRVVVVGLGPQTGMEKSRTKPPHSNDYPQIQSIKGGLMCGTESRHDDEAVRVFYLFLERIKGFKGFKGQICMNCSQDVRK